MNRLERLRAAGVSIWLDTLSRDLLDSGGFERHVREHGVTGVTANPTILERALAGSTAYDHQLGRLAGKGTTAKAAFFDLALDDVRRAAALLRPAHAEGGGHDGFVSFEVTPDLAHDAAGTVDQALAVWRRLDLSNVMIKVPATRAGLRAIERLTAFGVNVNVTLLFSVERYEEVVDAYMRGLERRLAAGRPLDGIASAASFFVSRIDSKADPLLPPGSPLRGRIAVANAQRAYARGRELFGGARWARLRAAGGREQRPLWASTATKDPSLSDVYYVERLIAPGTIDTMPEATLLAFADHGEVRDAIDPASEAPRRVLAEAAEAGIDLDRIAAELEREGIESFSGSYRRLLERLGSKLGGAERPARPSTRTSRGRRPREASRRSRGRGQAPESSTAPAGGPGG
jgi:transaldolase